MKNKPNTLSEVEKGESKWLDRVIVVAAVVIVIAALLIFLGKKSGRRVATTAVQQMEQIAPDYSYILDNLEGNYDIKLSDSRGQSLDGVARIKFNDIEGYDLIIYSEYSPVTYHFKVKEGLSLTSDMLGDGIISYEKDFEQTTITFKTEDSVCELSR